MPIYSQDVDPWVPLHSSIGSGPRGNGLYVSSVIYTTTNTDIYHVSIGSLQGPDVEDAHDGDLVAFKSKFGDITFYHIGVVTSRNSTTLTVRSVIRSDEWSVDQAQMKRDWDSLKVLVDTAIENAESATDDMNDLIDEIRETLANDGFKGDKGDKGDAFVFEDFTDAQLLDLRQDVSSIYYRRVLNVYTTSQNDTTGNPAIALDADEFNSSMMLFVFVNGLLCSTTEYTVLAEGTVVRFNHAFSVVGTEIVFIGIKAIAITAEDYDALKGDPAPASEVSAAVATYLQSHPELVFVGATSSADGRDGLVPGPTAGTMDAVLFGDGSWSRIDITNDPTVTTGYSISLDKESGSDTETLGSLVIPVATSSAIGVMSAEDKAKLDGIETGANKIDMQLYLTSGGLNWAEISKSVSGGGRFAIPVANLDSNHLIRANNLPEIPEEKIADGAVTPPKLASSSVTNEKLASNSVTTAKITDGSVTTPKLADVSVTTEKLANSSVTAFKIRDGVITDEKLVQSGGVLSRVSTLEDKTRLATQAANGLMSAADKTKLDNMGDGTIPAGSITTLKLADSAVVTQKIADNAVTVDKLADNVVDSIKSDIQSDIQPIIDAAQGAAYDATNAAALATRAAANLWNSGNVPYGTLTGEVLTTDDAFAAPPKSVDVYGKSTQDGTPTPDAPVEIKSVDDLTLNITGENLFDATQMKDQAPWNTISVYAPVGTTLTMSTNKPQSNETPCYFRQPNSSQSSGNSVYSGHAISQTVPDAGYVEVVQRRASGEDSFANYQWQIEIGSTATPYVPYVGQSIEIPLGNNKARSLPDGTRDTLTLSYIGPSEREGWGVFGASLVQRVGEVPDLSTLAWIHNDASPSIYYAPVSDMSSGTTFREMVVMCGAYAPTATPSNAAGLDANTGIDKAICKQNNNNRFFIKDTDFISSTAEAFAASLAGINAIYPLATPVTHDLGTVELPVNPAPDMTAWADGGSAQPMLSMEYEQDINIVVNELRSAIADMATS